MLGAPTSAMMDRQTPAWCLAVPVFGTSALPLISVSFKRSSRSLATSKWT